MRHERVVVIGAGIGGLAAALDARRRAASTSPWSSAPRRPAARCARSRSAGAPDRRGPDRVHHALGVRGDVRRRRAPRSTTTSRCARPRSWPATPGARGERLDLFADVDRSADAIGGLRRRRRRRGATAPSAPGRAGIYRTLERPFIRAERPSLAGLARGVGLARLGDLWRIHALRDAVAGARRATSTIRACGSCSAATPPIAAPRPFLAPATLMLVAHVEQAGVWLVEGGMHRLAQALAGLAARRGADVPLRRRGRRDRSSSGGRVAGVRARRRRAARGRRGRLQRRCRGARAPGCSGRACAGAVPAVPRAGALALGRHLGAGARRPRGFPLPATTSSSPRDYRGRVRRDPARPAACRPTRPSTSAPRTATTRRCRRPDGPERLLLPRQRPGRRATPTLRRMRRSAHARSGPSRALERCGLQPATGDRRRQW